MQLVTVCRFRDILTEVNFIGGDTAVLRHPNILTASRCSLFKSHTSNFLGCHFYMALAFEPMADGSLADYVYDHWPKPFVACLMLQLLNALSYIHAQVFGKNADDKLISCYTKTSNCYFVGNSSRQHQTRQHTSQQWHCENHRLWQGDVPEGRAGGGGKRTAKQN